MNKPERAFAVAAAILVAFGECSGAEAPTYTTLYQFTGYLGGPDGSFPIAPLVTGPGGVLYGTTRLGGVVNATCPQGCGTVFSLTPPAASGLPWTETILHSFAAGSDGYAPSAALTIGEGGLLYATAGGGGASGYGTVFSLRPPAGSGGPWTMDVLHSFAGPVGPGADGVSPYGSLLVGGGGIVYGTTSFGGAYGGGRHSRLRLSPRALGPKPFCTISAAKATAPTH